MAEDRTRQGSSCFLQGCLFGAVGLFAVLLLVMLFLAFARFRDNTANSDAVGDVGAAQSPAMPLIAPPMPRLAIDRSSDLPSHQP